MSAKMLQPGPEPLPRQNEDTLFYTLQAVAANREQEESEQLRESYHRWALNQAKLGQISTASQYFHEALVLARGNDSARGKILYDRAAMYAETGGFWYSLLDLDEAIGLINGPEDNELSAEMIMMRARLDDARLALPPWPLRQGFY